MIKEMLQNIGRTVYAKLEEEAQRLAQQMFAWFVWLCFSANFCWKSMRFNYGTN